MLDNLKISHKTQSFAPPAGRYIWALTINDLITTGARLWFFFFPKGRTTIQDLLAFASLW